MRSFTVIIALFSLFYIINARPSWYYSSQDNSGYHPPYDFSASTNTLASIGLGGSSSCPSICPSGANTIAMRNSNYTVTGTGTCTNLPSWMQTGNLPIPSINFDSCCGVYEQCAQSCNTNKDYCDQQFYGCMWSQCAYSFRVRPGDRITCRAYATCYASFMTNNMTCERFNSIQQQACTCVSNGQTVPFASPSPSPAAIVTDFNTTSTTVNDTVVGKRQVVQNVTQLSPSASPIITQLSPSASPIITQLSPSASPIITQLSASASSTVTGLSPSASPLPTSNPVIGSSSSSSSSGTESSSSSSTNNNNDVNYLPGTTQYYRARPVMLWNDMSGQCPPNIGSYVNVMSDQEMDDINYYLSNSAGGLSMWLKYLF